MESDLGPYLNLSQSSLSDFHRIFGCPDLGFGIINIPQGGMKGGCFAGTSRTAYKNEAIRLCDGTNKIIVIAC